MHKRKRLYLYPLTKITGRSGGNSYILNLRDHLQQRFTVVNTQTGLGLLDVILKMPVTDIIYFNWIEDVVDKRFGVLQVYLLRFIVLLSKLFNVSIVWLIHNNVSHTPKNLQLKKKIVALMARHATVVLSHSSEARIPNCNRSIAVFEHPVEPFTPLPYADQYKFDLLVWGTVNAYKGVEEFLRFAQNSTVLANFKILIAGKFSSVEYYERIAALTNPNVTIVNKILTEAELVLYFAESRYILFSYNSASVLSSGALSKTLSFGKTIIGPRLGSFKELGAHGLIYTYTNFNSLEDLLKNITQKETDPLYLHNLQTYIRQHSWTEFVNFVDSQLSGKKERRLRSVH